MRTWGRAFPRTAVDAEGSNRGKGTLQAGNLISDAAALAPGLGGRCERKKGPDRLAADRSLVEPSPILRSVGSMRMCVVRALQPKLLGDRLAVQAGPTAN